MTLVAVLLAGGTSSAWALTPLPVTPSPAPVATPATPGADDNVVGGGQLGSLDTVVGSGTGVGALPTVTTASFVLADATTGRVLASRAPHLKRPPASTLKALTALTLIPRLEPQGTYKVAAVDTRVEGSRVGLVSGSTYTHDQLFTALFLPSANDAASALARSRGSVSQTVRQMNDEAQRLQALDTVAKNPSGLDADGQVSSAYDLALIGREGLNNPKFAGYAKLVRTTFPGKQPKRASQKRATFVIESQNRLLRDKYAGAIGVKTGFTSKAGRTYIGAAERNGTRLIVTLMGNIEPTEIAARRLLDWGFANAGRVQTPVGTLVEPLGPAPTSDVDAASAGGASLGNDTDPISASTSSASFGGSSAMLRWGVLIAAVLAAAGLIVLTYVGNGSLARRRIRRRYHR